MKTIITLTAAMIGAVALPVIAFAGQTADGCDTVQSASGGFYVIAGDCVSKTGGGSAYIDTNMDGAVDTFVNDKNR